MTTSWDVFWFLFLFLPLAILWVLVLVDLIRRPDLPGWQKALWVMGVIFVPWLGCLVYLIMRPAEPAARPLGAGPSGSVTQAGVRTGSGGATPTAS